MKLLMKIKDWIDYLYTNVHFILEARIYPLWRKRYYGPMYDWLDEKVKTAYWIKDRNGEWIGWAHFDKNAIMCCTPDTAMDSIEKE